MKSIITEHPKTSHKLSKTIRQAKNLGSNTPLHIDTKKESFLNEKKIKMEKMSTYF